MNGKGRGAFSAADEWWIGPGITSGDGQAMSGWTEPPVGRWSVAPAETGDDVLGNIADVSWIVGGGEFGAMKITLASPGVGVDCDSVRGRRLGV